MSINYSNKCTLRFSQSIPDISYEPSLNLMQDMCALLKQIVLYDSNLTSTTLCHRATSSKTRSNRPALTLLLAFTSLLVIQTKIEELILFNCYLFSYNGTCEVVVVETIETVPKDKGIEEATMKTITIKTTTTILTQSTKQAVSILIW